MSQNQKELSTSNKSLFQTLVDVSTKDKIRKHLSDVNDVITEDDIKNIRTDIFYIPVPRFAMEHSAK